MHNFKELKVWQLSRNLVKDIYELTLSFPKEELYGITSQIRRCSVSIPTNIAEGCGRNTNKDFAHFLNVSLGSAYELESLLYLCLDLKLTDESRINIILPTLSETQNDLWLNQDVAPGVLCLTSYILSQSVIKEI